MGQSGIAQAVGFCCSLMPANKTKFATSAFFCGVFVTLSKVAVARVVLKLPEPLADEVDRIVVLELE
jgi:hypothetical protein